MTQSRNRLRFALTPFRVVVAAIGAIGAIGASCNRDEAEGTAKSPPTRPNVAPVPTVPTTTNPASQPQSALMKHDFATSRDKAANDRFVRWLESETTDSLKRTYGNAGATNAAVFLYVNRAFEAHMPEELIAETFGKCVVRAGYREEDEAAVFDLPDSLGDIARQVHGGTGPGPDEGAAVPPMNGPAVDE